MSTITRAALRKAVKRAARETPGAYEDRSRRRLAEKLSAKALEVAETTTSVRVGASTPAPGCLYRQAADALGLGQGREVKDVVATCGMNLDRELRGAYRRMSVFEVVE